MHADFRSSFDSLVFSVTIKVFNLQLADFVSSFELHTNSSFPSIPRKVNPSLFITFSEIKPFCF